MFTRLKSSAEELKSTRSLVLCAALIALYIAIESFSIFSDSTQKFTLSFIALALLGARFGIVPSSIAAFACDLIGFFLKPMGAYHPGFAISKICTCIIFALFLYKKPTKLWRIITAKTLINILVNSLLNAYWLATLYSSKGYLVLLASHFYKNMILLPFEIIILFFVFAVFDKIEKKLDKNSRT